MRKYGKYPIAGGIILITGIAAYLYLSHPSPELIATIKTGNLTGGPLAFNEAGSKLFSASENTSPGTGLTEINTENTQIIAFHNGFTGTRAIEVYDKKIWFQSNKRFCHFNLETTNGNCTDSVPLAFSLKDNTALFKTKPENAAFIEHTAVLSTNIENLEAIKLFQGKPVVVTTDYVSYKENKYAAPFRVSDALVKENHFYILQSTGTISHYSLPGLEQTAHIQLNDARRIAVSGDYVITIKGDNEILFLDADSLEILSEITLDADRINTIAITDEHSLAAASDKNGRVYLLRY